MAPAARIALRIVWPAETGTDSASPLRPDTPQSVGVGSQHRGARVREARHLRVASVHKRFTLSPRLAAARWARYHLE